VVSHPCARKKAQGWGTGHLALFVKDEYQLISGEIQHEDRQSAL
jgi:hypothetical protein